MGEDVELIVTHTLKNQRRDSNVHSMPRLSPADAVEALLYGGEAVID